VGEEDRQNAKLDLQLEYDIFIKSVGVLVELAS
jgi:hypothetical protein